MKARTKAILLSIYSISLAWKDAEWASTIITYMIQHGQVLYK